MQLIAFLRNSRIGDVVYTLYYTRPGQFWHRFKERVFRHLGHSGLVRIEPFADAKYVGSVAQSGSKVHGFVHGLNLLSQIIDSGMPPEWRWRRYEHEAHDPALWYFHLHYMEWLRDLPPDSAIDVIRDWIRNNPPSTPDMFRAAWHPYVISRRLFAWIDVFARGGDAPEIAVRSLAAQYIHLYKHLEWEHRGNHLIANLIALVHGGAVLQSPAIACIRQEALGALRTQLDEQILPDGLHHERSMMYHLDLLELLVRLRAVGGDDLRFLDSTIERMKRAAASLRRPDGSFPLLGDSAEARTAELARRSEPPPPLKQEFVTVDNHFVWRDDNRRDQVLFDAAPLGVDHNGAHMHADLLNFEIMFSGVPIIVNGGAGIYKEGRERSLARSPAEHAVVTIDGLGSARPWKSFRTGWRAHPSNVRARFDARYIRLAATEDCLMPSLSHRRVIRIDKESRSVRVNECVNCGASNSRHRLDIHLPFHPDIALRKTARGYRVHHNEACVASLEFHWALRQSDVREYEGYYYRDFGVRVARRCLRVTAWFDGAAAFSYTFAAVDAGRAG